MIRLNDEHWQSNLQGAEWTKRLEDAVHERARRETFQFLVDEFERKGTVNLRMRETVAVTALDKKGRIKSVGINEPNDLIVNHFGSWLAGLIQPPTVWSGAGTYASCSMTDDSNSSRTVRTYGANITASGSDLFNYHYSASLASGTQLKVGSGSTAAARTDYAIETAFGTAPESGYFNTTAGSHAAAYISYSGAITAGGSGTVNETGTFGTWSVAGTLRTFMLFHDILGSGVTFVAGNTITVSYSISI